MSVLLWTWHEPRCSTLPHDAGSDPRGPPVVVRRYARNARVLDTCRYVPWKVADAHHRHVAPAPFRCDEIALGDQVHA
jgi:hypothetical protein